MCCPGSTLRVPLPTAAKEPKRRSAAYALAIISSDGRLLNSAVYYHGLKQHQPLIRHKKWLR